MKRSEGRLQFEAWSRSHHLFRGQPRSSRGGKERNEGEEGMKKPTDAVFYSLDTSIYDIRRTLLEQFAAFSTYGKVKIQCNNGSKGSLTALKSPFLGLNGGFQARRLLICGYFIFSPLDGKPVLAELPPRLVPLQVHPPRPRAGSPARQLEGGQRGGGGGSPFLRGRDFLA